MALDVAQFKQVQRRIWSLGDYPEIATRIESVADELVALSGIAPGQKVLDVATGSGNVAIVAAQAGAEVIGLDLTPELFDAARRRLAEAGLEVELVEGDAEDLPYPDDSFDRVLSAMGVMFAPRHEQAAAELVRVCRPGGVIGVAAWTPEGATGEMFKTVGAHMPPPPPELRPPMMWGNEQHVRDLFAPSGATLEFHRRMVTFLADSGPEWVEYSERVLGPLVLAREALEPQGKWDALHEDLMRLYERQNEATDGTMRVESEYLITVARLPE
jgi:SAM-dependent methyltransferase